MSEGIVFVVPTEGFTIVNPASGAVVPAEGQRVRHDSFWERMKKQGAVQFKKEKVIEENA